MRVWSRVRAWVGTVLGRRRMEREMDAELRFHIEAYAEDLVRGGMARQEAMRRARIEFGGVEQKKEECRDARHLNLVDSLAQDVRYGIRILGRTPVVTAVAIFSLALGIGANTAIFSLMDAVLLRMLPVQRPEELCQVQIISPERDEPNFGFTNPLWEQVRDRQNVFSGVFAWSTTQFDLAQGGAVHYVDGSFVSGSFFSTLGTRPAAGRLITAADDYRGCPAVAVLSHGFWQEHFAGSPGAIGEWLSFDKHPFQIIGVSAPSFSGVELGRKFDVAIPICSADFFDTTKRRLDRRSWWWLQVMGRVRSNLKPAEVKAGLATISPGVFRGALPGNYQPEDQKNFLRKSLTAVPASTGPSDLRDRFKGPLAVLMGVVGLVLLIACANIASLMFARSASRRRGIAVRKALGASRGRLTRQLLTECLLLSLAGAMLGMVFARWGAEMLVRYISTAQNSVFLELSLDARVLGFSAVIAVFTGLLFGAVPALRSTQVSLTAAMKGTEGEESERRARFRPGKWVVAAQVALSLVLLMVAGLFLRSFVKLTTLDLGFDRSNVLLVEATLKTPQITPEQRLAVYSEIEDGLRSLPSIVSASRSNLTPIHGAFWNNDLLVDSPNAPKGDDALAYFNYISPGYLGTMRTPLIAGRNFNAGDAPNSPLVAIVNEALARKFFPDGNVLGKYFRIQQEPGKTAPPIQIVGVVKNAKYGTLREETLAQSFFPISQIPDFDESETFELRTAGRPSTLLPAIQDTVARVNKSISLNFGSLSQQVDDSLVQERLLATISVFFGGLALILAMIGLYGAMSYLVTQRRSEFGVRMALGASPGSILGLVMRDVGAVLSVGVMAGVGVSIASTRVLQKLLFGLTANDTLTMLGALLLLSAVALVAGYIPARRAMRVDPMVALRYE